MLRPDFRFTPDFGRQSARVKTTLSATFRLLQCSKSAKAEVCRFAAFVEPME